MKATITELAYAAGVSERTVRRYLKDGKWPHTRLPGGLIEIEDSLLAPVAPEESTILEMLKRIESKIDALADMFRQAPAAVRHRPADVTIEQTTRARASPGPAQGELPAGLMAWRDYAKQQGYAETTVKRAIDQGKIPIITGRWKRGKVYILAAIDDSGKAAMDALFSGQ